MVLFLAVMLDFCLKQNAIKHNYSIQNLAFNAHPPPRNRNCLTNLPYTQPAFEVFF
jgi:hypothetical protein